MKTGRTISEVAVELDRIRTSAKDYTVPCSAMLFEAHKNHLSIDGLGEFSMSDLAHAQVSDHLGVPKKYYDRMREEQPILLEENVNTWLHAQPATERLVRTVDGRVRAFLSSKYRPLDNIDMLEAVVPTLQKSECRIESCEVTEKRFYLKAVSNNVDFILPEETLDSAKQAGRFREGGNQKRNDILSAGLVCSNSEVGLGGLTVEPLVWRRVCSNGLIITEAAFKKFHIGKSTSNGEGNYEFFRDDTRLADDRALWLKVRDTVAHVFEKVNFEGIVRRMADAANDVISQETTGVRAIEVTQQMFNFTDKETEGVLSALLREGDMSRYGVMNAVTRFSQDIGDYERATEFERIGGKVLDMSPRDWTKIATAH